MISRVVYRRQPGRRLLTGLAALSIVAGTLVVVSSNAIAFTQTNFELDKNATHTLASSHLGALKSSVTSSATSISVCELVAAPATPFTIQIDAEQMTVTAVSSTAGGTGGCAFANPADVPLDSRAWTVTRGAGSTTAAAHVGSAPRNDVTLIGSATGHDWDQVYADYSANPVASACNGSDLGAIACIWKNRPNTGTASSSNGFTGPTTFTGTSGDLQLISQWTWTNQSVPDADEINDALAIKYANATVNNTAGHQVLYVGMDRYAVNGSKDIGFWFFKAAVGPVDGGSFSGVHTVGDILLLSTFSGGGGTTTIRAYEWVGSGGSDGALNFLGSFGDCVPGNLTDSGCATTANTTVPAPWPHQEKPTGASAGVFYSGGFMEGGVDLTGLGLEGCFSSFMGTSRSSPSLTAQPKAFVFGHFENCSSGLTTTPADSTGTALTDHSSNSIPDVSIGTGTVSVTDSAALTVGGVSSFSGSIAFHICGPIASGLCTTGGYDAGSVTANANGTYTSAAVTLTSAGRYCWRGDFTTTTSGVPSASDSAATECFEVLPVTPTLATTATTAVGITGSISDTANLGGTATQPGTNGTNTTYPTIGATDGAAAAGTITFTAYGPGDATCTGTAAYSTSVNVSGDNASYGPATFTPTASGTYRWIASYSGNSPNTNVKATACNEANETSKVVDAYITLSPLTATNEVGHQHTITATVKQDTGTGSFENAPDGTTVTFSLLNNSAGAAFVGGTSTCTTLSGQCSVSIDTSTAGSVDIHATTTFSIGTISVTRSTGTGGNNSADANKVYVDAYITIGPPTATNSVGDPHTFTVNVYQDDGLPSSSGDLVNGFGPAPDGTIVTVTLTNGGGASYSVTSDTCATGTTGGSCSVTFSSPTAGTVTGHAAVTFLVGGVSLHRETDGIAPNSGDAVKTFVAGSIAWSKVDNAGAAQGGATFQVCKTATYDVGTGTFTTLGTPTCVSIVDNDSSDANSADGGFLYQDLSLGRYTVQETAAPAGFSPDPDVVTVELTPGHTVQTISIAFVNTRPIVKITGFGYTNAATGTPTSGIVSGTVTYTVTLHNYGGASTTLSHSSLVVSSNATCSGGNTLALTGTIAAASDGTPYSLTCTYSNLADGAQVSANLTVKYTTNALEREASGSPALVRFTAQAD